MISSLQHNQLPLDGTNIISELRGENMEEGRFGRERPIIYYCNTNLMAIRSGKYKVQRT